MPTVGRPAKPIILTDSEHRILERYARRFTSAQALAKRAGIVLALAEGKPGKVVERPDGRRRLGDAVERVRRSEWRSDQTVKGGRYALLKNLANLTVKPDRVAAQGFPKGWFATAMNSPLKLLAKAAKTITNRAKGILRWYTTRRPNAVLEGLNSFLQTAKRKARSYRLHRTFITMAYLIAGKLVLRAPSPFACAKATH